MPNTRFEHRKSFAYFFRDAVPAERCSMAATYITMALALIEDEIDMQSAYSQMDYSTIPMGNYRKCRELLEEAHKYCKLH